MNDIKFLSLAALTLIISAFALKPSVTKLNIVFIFSDFFFFQAEDGIRDVAVTGVQTCALPICSRPGTRRPARSDAVSNASSSAGRPTPPARRRRSTRSRPSRMRAVWPRLRAVASWRSEEHTSELQSRLHLVCRLLLEKKKETRR